MHTTGLAVRHWNGAFVTDPAADLSAALPRAQSWFAVHRMPYGVLVPSEWQLTLPGHSHVADQQVMMQVLDPVRAVRPAVPAGVTLLWEAPAEPVALVQAESFDVAADLSLAFVAPLLQAPGWQTVLATVAGEPVGCASVVVSDGVAGIYGVAVRPRWQRRGIGAGLTAAALRQAVDRGGDLAYLNPSEAGRSVYASLGFVDVAPMHIWLPASG